MKTLLFYFLLLSAIALGACNKNSNDVIVPNTPRTEVPDELVGSWLSGSFAMSNWWSYNGSQYAGNPYTRSVAFKFDKNGTAEFYLAIATFNGSCRTEGFTYFKGTVAFDEGAQSFTFHPQKGNFRGFYSCSPTSNFNRPATASELNADTYYFSFWTDTNGKTWLLTRFTSDPNETPTYFQAASW